MSSSQLDSLVNLLTILVTPPQGNPVVDIVMIHGLGGTAQRSWCKDGRAELFWPQQWLPQDIPNSRVSTFAYNANPATNPQGSIDTIDIALVLLQQLNAKEIGKNCSIMFVSHDMGGAIAKLVHRLSHNDSRYQHLFSKIKAMIFLGTPHRGADFYKTSKLQKYLKQLTPNSSHLLSELDYFRHYAPHLKICSFYESLPAGKVLVPKDTAVLGLPHERNDMFTADHGNMCRFTSRNDANYKKLVLALQLAVREVSTSQWDP